MQVQFGVFDKYRMQTPCDDAAYTDCTVARPRKQTRVTRVWGKAANHYTNSAMASASQASNDEIRIGSNDFNTILYWKSAHISVLGRGFSLGARECGGRGILFLLISNLPVLFLGIDLTVLHEIRCNWFVAFHPLCSSSLSNTITCPLIQHP